MAIKEEVDIEEEFFVGVCKICGDKTKKVSDLVIGRWVEECKTGCGGNYEYEPVE